MYDAETASQLLRQAPAMQRVKASARVRFSAADGTTRLADLYQSGSAKIRLPKVYGAPKTAVMINTAGGLTGGDCLDFEIAADRGAHAIVTGQTAERAYRSSGGSAKVTGCMRVDAGASLEWLPQETILFDGSSLGRTLTAEVAEDARLTMLESVVLGRKAMKETLNSVFFSDRWRVRRGGKLVFADDIRLDGRPETFLRGTATAAGRTAFATFADISPDAEDRLPLARSLVETLASPGVDAAVSAWNNLLVARFVALDGRALRSALMTFLTGYRSADLPRVWYC
ncbi:urease accessory protein [Rhodobacterales bacterium]|nr:urease accessory protein [Rhodobacterales bacterium]